MSKSVLILIFIVFSSIISATEITDKQKEQIIINISEYCDIMLEIIENPSFDATKCFKLFKSNFTTVYNEISNNYIPKKSNIPRYLANIEVLSSRISFVFYFWNKATEF